LSLQLQKPQLHPICVYVALQQTRNEGLPMFSLISLFLAARRPVTLPVAAPVAAAPAEELVELRLAA
jgi:hypothetical protein